jgi:hypothetical protein
VKVRYHPDARAFAGPAMMGAAMAYTPLGGVSTVPSLEQAHF